MDFHSHALLLEAIEQFRSNEELPKRTHIQKAFFFLQTMGMPGFPFSFILYKHSPFSPDVESELDEMKSYGAICYDSRPGFSQVLQPGAYASALKQKAQLNPEEKSAIASICRFLARKPLNEIELLGTVAWIKAHEHIKSVDEIASRLQVLKPHVSRSDAMRSAGEVERVRNVRE